MKYKNLSMDLIMEQDLVIFTMADCHACHEYIPRIEKLIKGKLNYMILDVDEDIVARSIAITSGVVAFPTTFLIKNNGYKSVIGSFSESKICSMVKEETGKSLDCHF